MVDSLVHVGVQLVAAGIIVAALAHTDCGRVRTEFDTRLKSGPGAI